MRFGRYTLHFGISVYTEQSKYRAHMFNLFNSSSLNSIHKYLKALGNYKRLIIYTRLLSVRRCNSTALYKSLYISQSTGSQHLKTLEQANLIYRERWGNEIICKANYRSFLEIVEYFKEAEEAFKKQNNMMGFQYLGGWNEEREEEYYSNYDPEG